MSWGPLKGLTYDPSKTEASRAIRDRPKSSTDTTANELTLGLAVRQWIRTLVSEIDRVAAFFDHGHDAPASTGGHVATSVAAEPVTDVL
jgi:hypothetical protein